MRGQLSSICRHLEEARSPCALIYVELVAKDIAATVVSSSLNGDCDLGSVDQIQYRR